MEDWVLRSLQRWPNVPALYGWLGLDRRGGWTIRGERISRPQIVDTIARNYAGDAYGRWYFQNGPQRGYLQLERAPLLLSAATGDLFTHTGLPVRQPRRGWLDGDGGLWLDTEHGPAALLDDELSWLLERLRAADGGPPEDSAVEQALLRPAGTDTGLRLCLETRPALPLLRLNTAEAGEVLGFEALPQPREGERAQVGGYDTPV
jgi:hypothetical protein